MIVWNHSYITVFDEMPSELHMDCAHMYVSEADFFLNEKQLLLHPWNKSSSVKMYSYSWFLFNILIRLLRWFSLVRVLFFSVILIKFWYKNCTHFISKMLQFSFLCWCFGTVFNSFKYLLEFLYSHLGMLLILLEGGSILIFFFYNLPIS